MTFSLSLCGPFTRRSRYALRVCLSVHLSKLKKIDKKVVRATCNTREPVLRSKCHNVKVTTSHFSDKKCSEFCVNIAPLNVTLTPRVLAQLRGDSWDQQISVRSCMCHLDHTLRTKWQNVKFCIQTVYIKCNCDTILMSKGQRSWRRGSLGAIKLRYKNSHN